MFQASLPKENTIGIKYVEGVIKDTHYGKIIGNILGVPYKEVYGIDDRSDGNIRNRFLFKVSSYDRYKEICTKFSGREIEIERGYRIRVEDISSSNTRVCISRVPFEINNSMLKNLFRKYGEVHSCEDYHRSYGIYKDMEGTGNRVIWMKLNQHIPQTIDINQTKNHILVKYPGQQKSCHKCGLSDHLERACKTSKDCCINIVDIDLKIDKSNENASDNSDPQIHMETSLNSIEYACINCSYCSSYEHILDEHMISHTGEKPYKCNMCGTCFKNKSELKGHCKTHESQSQHVISHTGDKPYKCNVCGKHFKTRAELKGHSKAHFGQSQHNVNTAKHGRKNNTKSVKSPKPAVDFVEICELDSSQIALLDINEKPFACNKCSSQFTTGHELAKHDSTHKKPEKLFYCTQCEYKCKNEKSFNSHFLWHNKGKIHKCTDCDFVSPSENTLKNHIKNHYCKRFGCTECGNVFSTTAELTYHMKFHSGENFLDVSFASLNVQKSPQVSAKRCISTSPVGRPSSKQPAIQKV